MSDRRSNSTRLASRSTPAALNTSEWLRQAARLVSLARARGPGHPEVVAHRERLVESLADLVRWHAPLVLRCSAIEIWLREEVVLRSDDDTGADATERGLPFLLYRDGVRGLTFDANASREDAGVLLDAIVRASGAPDCDEDIASLLWTADLDGLSIELAPFEEVVPGGALPPARPGAPGAAGTLALVEAPRPALAWPDLGSPVPVEAAWTALRQEEAAARAAWREAARTDGAREWIERVETLVTDVLAHDDGPVAREALSHALVSWLARAAQRRDWNEAGRALETLRRADPERTWSPPLLVASLGTLDADAIAERLDDTEPEEQGRFFALAVRIGRPAVDLLVRVLARAGSARVRAAASTALGYVCADEPSVLAPYVRDTRWHVARNIVFVLGQIGGEDAGDALSLGLRHADVRVRRTAVTALAQLPPHRRTPLLVRQLDVTDPATLTTVLGMLAREPDTRASEALIERIAGADFESRPEAVRLALIAALGEIAGDAGVPALAAVLNAGGWFAPRTPERTAAARALVRIGSARAGECVRTGLRSRADAVRAACQEALDAGEAVA
jgi:HEAT repeat protein